jgi:uncharacterized protein YbjT (DUF2867 family)
MKLLILGATGLVGGETLERALAEMRVDTVIAPTRRPLRPHEKLVNPVANDLQHLLPEYGGWAVDGVICALGTTMKNAGSKEAFRLIDYDLPLAFARAARRHGVERFALTSSKGASASSIFFYTRVKGELERDLIQIGFKSLTIVRPGAIGGHRKDARPMEKVVLGLLGGLAPVLPRGLRISRVSRIAQVLVEAMVASRPGTHTVESGALN